MKLKEKIYDFGCFVLMSVCLVAFLPFLLLCVLFRLIMMPYYYIKYKRSRYQAKAVFLDEFRSSVPERTCNQIVFFYQRKRAKRQNEKKGLDAMKTHDCFFLYEKGNLAEAIQKFIDTH